MDAGSPRGGSPQEAGISKDITTGGRLTIGLDLGDKASEACMVGTAGEVVKTFRVRTTGSALERALASFERTAVVLEVGTHSPWASRLAGKLNHEVVVANPRRVRLIAEDDSKSDRFDAELLARLGRLSALSQIKMAAPSLSWAPEKLPPSKPRQLPRAGSALEFLPIPRLRRGRHGARHRQTLSRSCYTAVFRARTRG